jgi:lysyl-tRNA synthetase class 2
MDDVKAPPPTAGRSEQEIYQARLHKAEALRALGLNPYSTRGKGGAPIGEIVKQFGALDAATLGQQATDGGAKASLAGRIVAERSFGKAGFLKLRDRSGEIQVYVKRDVLGEAAYEIVKLAEVGDIVAVEGQLFRSKTGELTVQAQHFRVLTKALRPLPEKWHGLQDLETRYRQRYLDLIANEEVRTLFLRRSRIVQEIRAFLDAREFVEVETPMMHSLISGAAARPFETHHNALDIDLYLRIAPELHLKRLVVGGIERVYEINRNFRNEGLSPQHNPEFTMLEFYWAYANYEDLIELTEQLFAHLANKVLGSTEVPYQGQRLDFRGPFRRLPMVEGVHEAFPAIQGREWNDAQALRGHLLADPAARDFNPAERQALDGLSAGELIARMFEAKVEKTLVQPTFVTQFPTAISPLARKNDENPEFVDRFELYVAGREIANAFNELNDPLDQRQRFEDQVRKKATGDSETMDYDEDYVRALEHGMPPTAGEGIGIDRLVMLLTDAPNIRDVILFPLMKSATPHPASPASGGGASS